MPFTLAWSEIRFARLRFALIVLVVALLSALVFVMGAIGVGLGHANVSAVRALPGDGLALQAEIDQTLPRSVLTREQVAAIAADPAVAWAEPLVVSSLMAQEGEEPRFGVSVLGVPADSRALPAGVRLGTGDAVLDAELDGAGIEPGAVLRLGPRQRALRIAATRTGATLSHQPTLFVADATAQQLRADLAGARASAAGTVSAAMIGLKDGRTLSDVAVPGVEAVERETAARAMPGYRGELMTSQLVQVCLYVIGAALLTTFFWMVTVQKAASLAVLRATGLSARTLAASLLVQVLGLTVAGLAVGWLIAAALTAAIPDAISAVLRAGDVFSAAAILLVLAVLAAGLALRTLLRTDPLLALQRP